MKEEEEEQKPNSNEVVNPFDALDEKREAEKRRLLDKVLSGDLKQVKEKVAFILNNYTAARNSDIELSWLYWKTFESDTLPGNTISKEQLMKLTKVISITRSRAKIQNEYRLFQADKEVRQYRGMLEEQFKDEAISDKSNELPLYSVYIDETGKTQDYLSVAGLWSTGGFAVFKTIRTIEEWKEQKKIEYEFHFNKLSNAKLDNYKMFFRMFLSLNPTIGFKTIIISNKGISDKNKAITDLTYHLIIKGVEHENSSGRAPLPRKLQVYIDNDEKGSDHLKLENIKERISAQKISGLFMGNLEAVDSKKSIYIQAVDLFAAAINRKLHNTESKNAKDQLADYILSLLNFDISNLKTTNDIDKSEVFNLTHEE